MATKNKRYYWLQLKKDFFYSKEMKLLRKIPGGDTYTVIYLKMMLASLEEEGKIYIDGVLDNPYEEIALEIDEDKDAVEITINFLISKNLITISQTEAKMEQVPELVGSETASTRRSRKHREQKALQCNTDATNGNGEIEKEKEKEIETDLQTDKDLNVSQSVGRPPGWSGIQSYLESQSLALSPKQIGELEDFMEIDGLEKSLIEKAIDITAGETGSKRSYKYLKGILTNWKNGNIKTVADQESNEAEREKTPKRIFRNKRLQEKWDNYDDSNDLF